MVTAMYLRHAKTLIAGRPGVGKTTLIRKIVEQIQPLSMSGFFTLEIRTRGYRSGFELRGLNGDRSILAHVGLESRYRVGKYGVDAQGFDVFLEKKDAFRKSNMGICPKKTSTPGNCYEITTAVMARNGFNRTGDQEAAHNSVVYFTGFEFKSIVPPASL